MKTLEKIAIAGTLAIITAGAAYYQVYHSEGAQKVRWMADLNGNGKLDTSKENKRFLEYRFGVNN